MKFVPISCWPLNMLVLPSCGAAKGIIRQTFAWFFNVEHQIANLQFTCYDFSNLPGYRFHACKRTCMLVMLVDQNTLFRQSRKMDLI